MSCTRVLTWTGLRRQLGQEASAARSVPTQPPPGVRQVSEPAQLDRYQSLVEQCGRPSPPAGTSPSRAASEPEFADAESGEQLAANGPQVLENGASDAPPAAEPRATVPVTWFGGEDATAVRRPTPR